MLTSPGEGQGVPQRSGCPVSFGGCRDRHPGLGGPMQGCSWCCGESACVVDEENNRSVTSSMAACIDNRCDVRVKESKKSVAVGWQGVTKKRQEMRDKK